MVSSQETTCCYTGEQTRGHEPQRLCLSCRSFSNNVISDSIVNGRHSLRVDEYENGGVERAVELRRIKRYNVQAPVFFSWKDLEGGSQAAEGMTRDISTHAVFVLARNCPAAGNQLRIDVLLPSLRSKKPGVRLRGEGVVLRVDRTDLGDSGFAVVACLRSGTRDSTDVLLNEHNHYGRTQ
jgi:hypothetical protein